ncbi:MAG: polyprenyl synthetase family protein [Ahrensia sp.]|nr:polyprenyl synthetase family protein [Ahrensia sp.]
MDDRFQNHLTRVSAQVSHDLENLLSQAENPSVPPRLLDAMRHGVLNGGKRLRPFLVLESAALFGVTQHDAMITACALECVHCYSLIHDDLPAMDDDDLRRGKPTVHKAYDEATAILAGDALLTLAFQFLSQERCHEDATVRTTLANMLAQACGAAGMIGGQMLDILAETQPSTEQQVRLLQSMKTGALIRFACEAGAVLGQADASQRAALRSFGEQIGLAFQLADDLLDVTAEAATIGKATGKDAAQGKGTLVQLLGAESTRSALEKAVKEAGGELSVFGDRAANLKATATFIAHRNY